MSLPKLNDTFPSIKAFKAAMLEYFTKEKFTIDVLQSNTSRVRYGCRSSAECSFRINCHWHEASTTATIFKVVGDYTCPGSAKAKRAPEYGSNVLYINVIEIAMYLV